MRVRILMSFVALLSSAAHGYDTKVAPSGGAPATTITAAAAPAASKLKFTNELVDGKKTWLPGEAKVTAGKVELTLVNTLTEPHGFAAPGLTEEIVVGGKETKTVTVDASKAGAYKFHCQLHPAHVGGSILVQ